MIKETLGYLVSRRWWWVTLIVLLAMVVMVRLSIWQVDRLQQRRAANALLRQQLTAAPLSLNEVDLQSSDLTTMPDRKVQATGVFDYSEQILLKVQNFNGSAGAHLVAPLRLEGRDEAVLVDRGWIPEQEIDPASWSQFDETGAVTIEGVIQLTQTARNAAPPEEPQQEWFRINVEAIERQVPYDLLPVYVLQSPPEGGNQALPYREEPEIDLSEGPHLSYAVQWVAFSIMLAAGYVYYVRRQEKQASSSDSDPSSPK